MHMDSVCPIIVADIDGLTLESPSDTKKCQEKTLAGKG